MRVLKIESCFECPFLSEGEELAMCQRSRQHFIPSRDEIPEFCPLAPIECYFALESVCRWIVETYPEDIFVTQPEVVTSLRTAAKRILRKLGTNASE